MELLTPFNYHQWKEDMEMQLHSKRLFRLTMDTTIEPTHYVDKEKYQNRLDEAYECLCLSISWDLLFYINGLKTPKEVWDNIDSLFDKQDDLRIYLLETFTTLHTHFGQFVLVKPLS